MPRLKLCVSAEMNGTGDNHNSMLVDLPDNWAELSKEERQKIAEQLHNENITELVGTGFDVVIGDEDSDDEDPEDWDSAPDEFQV